MDSTVFLFHFLHGVKTVTILFFIPLFQASSPGSSVFLPLLHHFAQLLLCHSISFLLLLFLFPVDVSPRRRILNVSRSVWKQANVASDLWEKLTARCVDRHRSAWIKSALGPEPGRVWGAFNFLIRRNWYCVWSVSNPTSGFRKAWKFQLSS